MARRTPLGCGAAWDAKPQRHDSGPRTPPGSATVATACGPIIGRSFFFLADLASSFTHCFSGGRTRYCFFFHVNWDESKCGLQKLSVFSLKIEKPAKVYVTLSGVTINKAVL